MSLLNNDSEENDINQDFGSVYWPIKWLVAWMIGFLFFGFVLHFVFERFFEQIHSQVESKESLQIIMIILFIIKIILYQLFLFGFLMSRVWSRGATLKKIWGAPQVKVQYALSSLFLGIIYGCCWAWITVGFHGWSYYSSVWSFCALLVGLVFLAPFSEEVFFRGIFYNSLRKYHKKEIAMLISAVFFSIYHVEYFSSYINLSFVFCFGLLTIFFAEKTKSLTVSFLSHVCLNLTFLVINNKNIFF